MFIVLLSYKKGAKEADAHMEAHRDYLRAHYKSGIFLASGRKEPRTGGVILADAPSKEALEAILAEDPFNKNDVARYEIVEFLPTMTAPELDRFKVS